jgi:lipoprotein-releasing system permease protein
VTGDQALVAALIGVCSFGLALLLMAGLWIFGLRVLEHFSRRRASFELIVALGHLRGRKSGYLKIMTLVVLLAITMANFTLPIVLSVMGGFGDDLKQKILDATAHILVDSERPDLDLPESPADVDFDRLAEQLVEFGDTKIVLMSAARDDAERTSIELERRGVDRTRVEIRVKHGTSRKGVRVAPADDERALRDFDSVAKRIAAIDGVTGVTPFIDADVMLASQTNIAAVVLKGVETKTMGEVINIGKIQSHGASRTEEESDEDQEVALAKALDYLDHPEKILPDVLAEQRRRLKQFLDESGIDAGLDAGGDDEDVGPEVGRPYHVAPDGGVSPLPPRPPPPPSPPGGELDPPADGEPQQTLPGVIVGRELAKTLRVFVGDEVNVVSPLGGMGPLGPIPKSRPFRSAGVFYSGMYQDDAKNAYVRLDVAQRFLGMEDRVSGLRIRVDDIEHAAGVAKLIKRELGPRYRVRPWEEVNANLFSALRLEKIAMFALYSIFFIICAFLIASTLTMMVLEKRRGIAVLKTLGASNLRLGAVFMLQGIVAGLVGTISGQIAAFVACVGLGTFVEIQPEVYYIPRLPVAIEPLEFATVAGLALLTAAVATVLPLAATVVLRPVDGLRL